MRTILAVAVLSCALWWPQGATSQDEQLDEPVLVIRHPPRLVYFERAPRNIRTAVERIMGRHCSDPTEAERLGAGEEDAATLICRGSDYTVMHAVNYRRETNGYAYACLTSLLEEDEVFPQYYEEYFHERFRCVVMFDQTAMMNYRIEAPSEL